MPFVAASSAPTENQLGGFLLQLLPPQTEKHFELLLQLGGMIISALTAVLVGLLAYVVARQQAVAARTTKEIERQRLLHELEGSFAHLTSTPAIWIQGRPKFESKSPYRFIVALTGEFHWDAFCPRPQHVWMESDRLLVFTHDNALLNSTVLHEFLFWFRRVARAHVAGLINERDLSELWRQTLPFATDLRYSFLARYFGASNESTADEDIAAITLVLKQTIKYCVSTSYCAPLHYLAGRLDSRLESKLDAKAVTLLKNLESQLAASSNSPKGQSAP